MASSFSINALYLELYVMIHESKMSTTYIINSAIRGYKDILEPTVGKQISCCKVTANFMLFTTSLTQPDP